MNYIRTIMLYEMKILYRNIYLASNQRIRNNGPSNCIIYAYDYYLLRILSSRTNT